MFGSKKERLIPIEDFRKLYRLEDEQVVDGKLWGRAVVEKSGEEFVVVGEEGYALWKGYDRISLPFVTLKMPKPKTPKSEISALMENDGCLSWLNAVLLSLVGLASMVGLSFSLLAYESMGWFREVVTAFPPWLYVAVILYSFPALTYLRYQFTSDEVFYRWEIGFLKWIRGLHLATLILNGLAIGAYLLFFGIPSFIKSLGLKEIGLIIIALLVYLILLVNKK